jgi:hypothetical protein
MTWRSDLERWQCKCGYVFDSKPMQDSPLHITQLIHEHEMYTNDNSGCGLIANIANALEHSTGLDGDKGENQYNTHTIAIAAHKGGEIAGAVLAVYTMWKEWDQIHDECPCYRLRIGKGFNRSGESWSLTRDDDADAAHIATALLQQIYFEMLFRRTNPTKDFTIHRVTIVPARLMPVWSDYAI